MLPYAALCPHWTRYGTVQFSSYLDDKGLEVEEDPTFKSKPRATLCISSQIGCAMG